MRGSGHVLEHDRWMIHPDDVDYLAPADRWCRVCGKTDREHVCSTCGRRADDPYTNLAAGERCADPLHGPFAPVGSRWKSETDRDAVIGPMVANLEALADRFDNTVRAVRAAPAAPELADLVDLPWPAGNGEPAPIGPNHERRFKCDCEECVHGAL